MSERFCYMVERLPLAIDDDVREWAAVGLRLRRNDTEIVTMLSAEGDEVHATYAEFKAHVGSQQSTSFELWIDDSPDVVVSRTNLPQGTECVFRFLGLSDARITPIIQWALERFRRRAIAGAAILTTVDLRSNTSPSEWRAFLEHGVAPTGSPNFVAAESRRLDPFLALGTAEILNQHTILHFR